MSIAGYLSCRVYNILLEGMGISMWIIKILIDLNKSDSRV